MKRLLCTSLLAPLLLAVPAKAAAAPAGCPTGFTVAQHHRYATHVFHREHITHHARRRLQTLRRCQIQGVAARHAIARTERRLSRWRANYLCTQTRLVNCIRGATRRYGGSFAHNVACARSESGLNPYARNASGAAGAFQFLPSTFQGTLRRMGVGAKSIYSAEWNARAAVWKFAHDGYGEWSGAGC